MGLPLATTHWLSDLFMTRFALSFENWFAAGLYFHAALNKDIKHIVCFGEHIAPQMYFTICPIWLDLQVSSGGWGLFTYFVSRRRGGRGYGKC